MTLSGESYIRVRIETDDSLPTGQYVVGGVWIAKPQSDADLGRALRTRLVRCHSRSEAALRMLARQHGWELADDVA